jgi:hypothetical protein
MDLGPRTFRDPFLSLYQSVAAEVARAGIGKPASGGALEGLDGSGALESMREKSEEVVAAELAAAQFAADSKRAAGLATGPEDGTALEEMGLVRAPRSAHRSRCN